MRVASAVKAVPSNSIKTSRKRCFDFGYYAQNVGFEQDGKGDDFRRPVLIFKKFNNDLFLGIPMSTQNKDNKYYVKILLKDIEQSAIISQLRVLDTKRLDDKIGYISQEDFSKIKSKVIYMLSNKM